MDTFNPETLKRSPTMIPKIIHYCWLSGDKYPASIDACISTWKTKLPDYESRKLLRLKNMHLPLIISAFMPYISMGGFIWILMWK